MLDPNAITGLLKLMSVVLFIALGYFRGQRTEKRHLAELAEREKRYRDVLVFATRHPPSGDTPHDPVLVSGSVVVASDYFRMFVAGLRKIFGGRFHAYETLVARARREAVLRMKEQAKTAGCEMIFNVRIQTTRIAGAARGGGIAAVEALVYGTALAPAPSSVAESPHHYQPGIWLPDGEIKEHFDLLKNPATRGALWVLPLAAAIAFAELVGLQDYNYVDGAPMLGLSAVALPGAAGLYMLFRKYTVPAAESTVLCVLSGLVIIAVSYFAALRINALTDFSPLRPSVYVLQRDGKLHPKDTGLPILYFDNAADYWLNQPVGSEHLFTLRRGIFGFWQFDGSEYRQKMREYRIEHRYSRKTKPR